MSTVSPDTSAAMAARNEIVRRTGECALSLEVIHAAVQAADLARLHALRVQAADQSQHAADRDRAMSLAEKLWRRASARDLAGDFLAADEAREASVRIERLETLLRELVDIEGPCPGTGEWAKKVRAALAEGDAT